MQNQYFTDAWVSFTSNTGFRKTIFNIYHVNLVVN